MMGTGTDGRTSYDFFYGVFYKQEHLLDKRDHVRLGHEKVDEDMLLLRAKSLPDSDKDRIRELIESDSGWIYINDGHGLIVKVENGRPQGFVKDRFATMKEATVKSHEEE